MDPESAADPAALALRRALAEVESPGFEVAFRGYDPAQVHALLERVAGALRAALERPAPAGDDGSAGTEVLPELVRTVADEVARFRADARAEVEWWTEEARTTAAALVSEAEERANALVAAARRTAAETVTAAEAEAAAVRARVAAEASAVAAAARARMAVETSADRDPAPAEEALQLGLDAGSFAAGDVGGGSGNTGGRD